MRLPSEPPHDAPADASPPERSAAERERLDRDAENREEHRLLTLFRSERDPRVFDELVRRTEGRVRGVALAILRNAAEADDAAQEAYLRAFRRSSSYRGEGPVGAWLCRIAVRCAHDALRRAGRQRRLVEVAAPDESERSEERAEEVSERLRQRTELESALRTLVEAEREALVLKEVAGMTYQEIAASCGVPLGTIQSRIHRARQRLAAALSPEKRT